MRIGKRNQIRGIYKYWLGKKRSSQTRRKMSEFLKNNPINYWSGKHRSEETKKKISKTLLGGHFSVERRRNISRGHGSEDFSIIGQISPHERKMQLVRRRRVRKIHAEGSHTPEEWEILKSTYN